MIKTKNLLWLLHTSMIPRPTQSWYQNKKANDTITHFSEKWNVVFRGTEVTSCWQKIVSVLKDVNGLVLVSSFLSLDIFNKRDFRTLSANAAFCKTKWHLLNISVMHCAIWYHLYNLKNVKNTHGEVLLLVKF